MFKYNIDGEWRPLCFDGDVSGLQKRIREETSDERIQGSLFYIRTTGFKVIEFVVKGSVVLPAEQLKLPNGVTLRPCVDPDATETRAWDGEPDLFIYDGWVEVSKDSAQEVMEALNKINWAAGLLSHVFNCSFDWTLKYIGVNHGGGDAIVTEQHVELLMRMVEAPLNDEAKAHLQSALDWLAHSKRFQSVFNRYLACWIAMEGLANMLYEGRLFPERKLKELIRPLSIWARVKLSALYAIGRINEIQPSSKVSSAQIVRASLEHVFGSQQAVDAVYKKKVAKKSLAWIRNGIAHGNLQEWNMKDLDLVREAFPILESIVTSFVRRLILELSPQDRAPTINKSIRITMHGDDPRSAMVCSDLRVMTAKSWRIKSKWIEPRT